MLASLIMNPKMSPITLITASYCTYEYPAPALHHTVGRATVLPSVKLGTDISVSA